MNNRYDLVIAGGGLAGSLFLAGLKHHYPKLNILLIEKNETLGGNHTWCFHDHDVPNRTRKWLEPLISKSWDSYEVKFPRYSRILNSKYHCIRSEDLHQKIHQLYSKNISFNTTVETWNKPKNEHGFTLHLHSKEGKISHIHTNSFIDARGWIHPIQQQTVAWQKFVGLELKLKNPHGLTRVLLKDVTIPQIDGYRFFYLLPFSEDTLLIEDTYYSNHSILKNERIELEIEKYAKEKGWEIEQILRKEKGCLPLTMYLDKSLKATGSSIGAASLYFNPVTGYTFPQTIQCIDALLERASLSQESIVRILSEVRKSNFRNEKYFRLLNRMMFLAAEPTQRYIILERFYQLKEDLIARFYSGNITLFDQMRILMGKPPVSVTKALRVLSDHTKKITY